MQTSNNLETSTTPQQRFEAAYITAAQIADIVGVSRVAVYKAADCKRLPPAISVDGGGVKLWERATSMEVILRWRDEVKSKRYLAV